MFSDQQLVEEIEAIVDSMIAQKVEVRTEWLAQSVVSKHPEIYGTDKDFYVLCAYGHTKDRIRSVVRRYKPDAEGNADKATPLFPGFERLQLAYHVERDGESRIVPVEQLTDSEIDTKAREYESMAEGCRLHANELRRYKGSRTATA